MDIPINPPPDPVQAKDYEDLDEETRGAIERAEIQYNRGEGIPLDEAFAKLRQKHFGF
jgi:hypothetical protein